MRFMTETGSEFVAQGSGSPSGGCLSTPAVPGRHEVLKFVRHHEIEQHLQQGWMPAHIEGVLRGTNHGHYAEILVWLCPCKIP